MFKKIILGLLVFAPLAILAELQHWDPVLVFIFSALAIIPVADLIGEATEELAHHTGPQLGGLLNATLGNAAELIITIFALRAGLVELVVASITGSIIGNLLLVMGLALLLGGLKNGIQAFDRRRASTNATLLILAVVALIIPSIFNAAIAPDLISELRFSEGVAVVMIVLYGLSVLYSFQTSEGPHNHEAVTHEGGWSVRRTLITLLLATVGVAILSEFLVGSVEVVTESLGLTEFFIGIIIIPLVGNIAEHLVAVEVAIKNKMELSLAVALGSSLQIALFVAPVLVFISLLIPGTQMYLIFTTFELVALFSASLIAAFIAFDGESNWLEGAILLGIYLIIGLAFLFLPG